jgi:hypothetical protein
VACLQLHAERRVRERFNHDALCSEVVVLACDVSLLSIRPSSTAHEGYTADRQHAAAYRSTPRSGTSAEGSARNRRLVGSVLPEREDGRACEPGGCWTIRSLGSASSPCIVAALLCRPLERGTETMLVRGPSAKGSNDLRVIPTGTATSTRYLRLGGRPARLIVLRTG